jgi:serine/threonine protein kinase
MSNESDPLVGIVLGDVYKLVGRIGQGGMGAVYEAHHLRLRKRVAVKVLNRAQARNSEALARFHREAVVASRLGHPNLVNVIDFGSSSDEQPYLVMEFLEGEDLDRRIQRSGSVPLPKAIIIARQIASAVAAVHAKGIIHRDLTPANVFLVRVPHEPDFVKVLDFGVSKIKADQSRVTDASRTVGTPAYMAPEQAFGPSADVDHRVDQWALACIVWEMLTGRPPFFADNADALFYQLRHFPPPPLATYAPDIPAAVELVLLRALSKAPTDRYPTIRDFARDLEAAALAAKPTVVPAALASESPTEDKTIVWQSSSGLDYAADLLGKARALAARIVRWLPGRQAKTRAAALVASGIAGIVLLSVLFGRSGTKTSAAVSPKMALTETRPAIVTLPSADAAVAALDSVAPAQVKTVDRKPAPRATKTEAVSPRLTTKRTRHRDVHSKSGPGRTNHTLTLDDF